MEALLVVRKTIIVPFADEAHYEKCMEDGKIFREFLARMYAEHPELFLQEMDKGYELHGFTGSRKQEGFCKRRIVLKNGMTYQVHPSFMMPYLIGKTEEAEKALYLRKWGVPFGALAYVFGKDPTYWYRAYVALGRNSVAGTTVRDPDLLPKDLVADGKHTRINGEKICVTTTVTKECIPGVGLAHNSYEEALTGGYQHFKEEALNPKPDYQPESVNTDGYDPTQISIRDRCRRHKELFSSIKEKVWNCYHAPTLAQFSQRIHRLRQWAQHIAVDPVREKVLSLCDKSPQFKPAFAHPEAYRTGNAPDRLMNYQDRLLYSRQYFHGTQTSTLLSLRAMALMWNFHPYSLRVRKEGLGASHFEELNGFGYHPNWLQNMLVASSLGGWKI